MRLTNWKRNILKVKLFSHTDSVLGCSVVRMMKKNVGVEVRHETQRHEGKVQFNSSASMIACTKI